MVACATGSSALLRIAVNDLLSCIWAINSLLVGTVANSPIIVNSRRRAEKIRAKLNWPPGLMNLAGGKPKGIHWKTYVRLMAEYRDNVNQTMLGMNAKMELLTKRVEALCDRY